MDAVLLVEDSEDIQQLVIKTLGKRFEVTPVATLADANNHLDKRQYDLVIIDVMLPDGNGFQLCSSLQNNDRMKGTPIIFLTAQESINDKLMAFSLGADDYIVKPFDPLELKARAEAKLKKYRERREEQEVIQKENLLISVPYQKAFLVEGGQKRDLGLTPIEFRILLSLVRRECQVFTRDQLLTAVWGEDVYILDRSIDTHMSSLRKKLGAKSYYIQSVYGSGYLFSTIPKKQPAGKNGKVPTATPNMTASSNAHSAQPSM